MEIKIRNIGKDCSNIDVEIDSTGIDMGTHTNTELLELAEYLSNVVSVLISTATK